MRLRATWCASPILLVRPGSNAHARGSLLRERRLAKPYGLGRVEFQCWAQRAQGQSRSHSVYRPHLAPSHVAVGSWGDISEPIEPAFVWELGRHRAFELHASMDIVGGSKRHTALAHVGARDEPCNHDPPTASKNFPRSDLQADSGRRKELYGASAVPFKSRNGYLGDRGVTAH